jgi:hypothetical protein
MIKDQMVVEMDADSYVEMWGLMQSCIADDGLASVKTDTDYAAALNIYYYYINAKYQ